MEYPESHLWGNPTLPRKNRDTKFKKRKLCDWPVAHPEVLKGFCDYLELTKVPEVPPNGEVDEDLQKRAATMGGGWVEVGVEAHAPWAWGLLQAGWGWSTQGLVLLSTGTGEPSTIQSPFRCLEWLWASGQHSHPSSFLLCFFLPLMKLESGCSSVHEVIFQNVFSKRSSPSNMQNPRPLWCVKICWTHFKMVCTFYSRKLVFSVLFYTV